MEKVQLEFDIVEDDKAYGCKLNGVGPELSMDDAKAAFEEWYKNVKSDEDNENN